MIFLYKITNLINNKVYIGQSNKEKERWRQHKYFGRNPERTRQYIHRAMAKYGIENFGYEIIAICRTTEDADITETELIKQYDSRNKEYGYNVAPGGEAPWNRGLPSELQPMYGKRHSVESKSKIINNNLGKQKPKHSDDWKDNMSKIMTGRIFSEDWKNKISESNKGRIISEEHKDRLRILRTNAVMAPETKEKISLSLKGIIRKRGDAAHASKLTYEIAHQMREEFKSGNFSKSELARKYNVSTTTAINVINNKIWKIDD